MAAVLQSGNSVGSGGGRFMSGRRVWLLSVSLADLLFLYLPIGVLILFSFNASRLSATWQGFTFQWYRALAADEALMASLQNSLLVASVSTMIATVLGMSAAVSLERFQFRRQQVVEGALLLPLVMPEVMMGVALMLFFVTIKLPVVMVMVRARLRKLDPGLEEAARDLGATPWQAFQRVTLPLLMPAMIGAALMAFTISFDDFIVTFFTAGPGSTTLPLRVYSMVRSGVSPVINALSAVLVAISIALITLALTLQGGFQTH